MRFVKIARPSLAPRSNSSLYPFVPGQPGGTARARGAKDGPKEERGDEEERGRCARYNALTRLKQKRIFRGARPAGPVRRAANCGGLVAPRAVIERRPLSAPAPSTPPPPPSLLALAYTHTWRQRGAVESLAQVFFFVAAAAHARV